MTINMDILYNQEIRNYRILFNLLMEVNYSDKEVILQIERQTYEILRKEGRNINGLVILATTQMMLGNHQKAVAIAHNIWDIGGEFDDYGEVGYTSLLINLGLFDLVSILLKPKTDEFEQNINHYFYFLLKFSLITGDLNLMDRLLHYTKNGDLTNILYDFTNVYRTEEYQEHFKKIQEIMYNNCKNVVCSFEYSLFYDRGFTDVEIFIYVGQEVSDIKALEEKINKDIENYFIAMRAKRIYNLDFTVVRIENHPPLGNWKV